MIGALIVLLAVVGVFTVMQRVNQTNPPSPVQTVDYQRDVPYARRQANFDLVAPPSLPAGWRATTVNFTDGPRAHWHLGCLTDRGRYVGLEQGDEPVADMLNTYVDPEPVRGKPVTIDGARWATYTDGGGDLALVRRAGRTSTLVVGHEVSRPQLVAYIRSLR
jgi:hypothetical protein